LDDVQVHVFDGAHFLPETHTEECATLIMLEFIQRVIDG
jgi:surfactin synthase thioesterase subunit